jgi:hypothetical protein
VLENPISESRTQRDGISYVISRMDWYWHLSELLETAESKTKALGDELKQHVEDLYKKLLLYQMKSVYSLYYRGWAITISRNMIKLDDWANALQSVKDAEKNMQQDIDVFNNFEIRTSLNTISRQARDRQTKLQDIHLAIRESTQKQEDRQQDEQTRRCLADLRLTDPREDKHRIAATKGGLFQGASNWIFDHGGFRRWRDADDIRLLVVKGDPGKGKTMLLIAIVEDFERQTRAESSIALSYFFCQGTDRNLNNATAVLRGLIYQLCDQTSLVSHLRARYDHAGAKLFQDANSFYALSKVLENIIHDERLQRAYLIVDALDECMADRDQLLRFIARHTVASPCVKWIVSSRNVTEIENLLEISASDNSDDSCGSEVKLSLEVTQNAEQVALAVEAFIDHKLLNIRSLRDDHGMRHQVRDVMREKANGTFLWVALVAEELEKAKSWRVLEVVKRMPATLEAFYDLMMDRARKSEEGEWENCQLVLSAVTLSYRPLHLAELAIVSRLPAEIADHTNRVQEVVALCGSFLTVKENEAKERVVYLIHQSVKDYLSGRASATIFPDGRSKVHSTMFAQSVQALSTVLRRNIYDLPSTGVPIDDVQVPKPNPLASVQYSCVFWARHFSDISPGISGFENDDLEMIDLFIRSFFLYWLEALSLCRSMSDGVVSMAKLEALLQVNPNLAFTNNRY